MCLLSFVFRPTWHCLFIPDGFTVDEGGVEGRGSTVSLGSTVVSEGPVSCRRINQRDEGQRIVGGVVR